MALARRRGVDEDASITQDDTGGEPFYSPGQEKKLGSGGTFHNREESVGGWIGGGKGLFGNAVKLFENVGDVVTNIVAPLDENDESFDEPDGHYDRWGKEHAGDESWIEEKSVTQSHCEIPVETRTIEASSGDSYVSSSKSDSFSPPSVVRVGGGDEVAGPLSAPSVDPRFLEMEQNKFNDSNDFLGNVSIDIDTPVKGSTSSTSGGSSSGSPAPQVGEGQLGGSAHHLFTSNTTTDARAVQHQQELDRGKGIHERYRSDTSAKMAELQERLQHLEKELRAARELSKVREEELKRVDEQREKDAATFEEQVRILTETLEERTRALERVSDVGGSNSEQLDSFRQAMEQQDEEVMKLQGFLQESEDRLKEHEELTWAAKAEQSELLFALECEKKAVEKAVRAKETLQTENEALKEELKTLRRATDGSNTSTTDLPEAATKNGDHSAPGDQTSQAASLGSSSAEESDSSSHTSAPHQAIEAANTHFELQQIRRLELELKAIQEELSNSTDARKLAEDALLIERNDKEDSVEAKIRAERALTQELKEKEQLQVVIAQLRAAKRSSTEEVDSISKERDELKSKVHNLQQAWTRDTQALSKVSKEAAEGGSQVGKLEAALQASVNRVEETESALSEVRKALTEAEKSNYDLTTYCDVLQSDNMLQKQELEQKTLETSNLQSALSALEQEMGSLKRKSEGDVDAARKEAAVAAEAHVVEAVRQWKQKLEVAQADLLESQQRVEDECLLRRKAQIDLNNEKKHMQKSLEGSLAQLRNSQADVVDRALIANLLASYFEKGYRKDILVLISKVLSFNEDQLVSVGLAVPRNLNIVKSIVDGIKKAAAPGIDGGINPEALEGDTLAELWVNYLSAEAGVDGTGSAGEAPPRSTSALSSPKKDGLAGESSKSKPKTKPKPVPVSISVPS